MARVLATSPTETVAARAAIWTLTVLTVLNLLNYIDRYVVSGVLSLLERDPIFRGRSDAELGAFQTWFLYVYMCVSPLAGALGQRVPRKFLVAAGVAVWSAATIASGLVTSYGEMVLARAATGFGEAGYATVAPAILSDLFARERRNRILSLFYLATPVGVALGYIVGGTVGGRYGWRPAFFVAGVPGMALALAALFTVEPQRGVQDEPHAMARVPLFDGLRLLLHREYVLITAGTTMMVFGVGGLAFWMPRFLHDVRGMSVGGAGGVFGVVTVVAGIAGTALGRSLGDAWERRGRGGYLKLSGLGLLVSAPFALVTPFISHLPTAFALAFLAELFVFVNTGPLNTALVNAAPPEVRELGVGLNVLAIHLLGDAISPPLLGALRDGLVRHEVAPGPAASLAVAATALPLVGGGLLLLRAARPPSSRQNATASRRP
jgi:MFS transporter, Spinster family, sphingosine-1-phosphate transporter